MRRILTVTLFILILAASAQAQNGGETRIVPSDALELESAVICRDVVDRNPVGPGTEFPATVDRLYCFTHVLGALQPTGISHVWYHQDREMGRVDLRVGSQSWRTFSSKNILQGWTGPWHVDILGPDGSLLRRLSFEIEPLQ